MKTKVFQKKIFSSNFWVFWQFLAKNPKSRNFDFSWFWSFGTPQMVTNACFMIYIDKTCPFGHPPFKINWLSLKMAELWPKMAIFGLSRVARIGISNFDPQTLKIEIFWKNVNFLNIFLRLVTTIHQHTTKYIDLVGGSIWPPLATNRLDFDVATNRVKSHKIFCQTYYVWQNNLSDPKCLTKWFIGLIMRAKRNFDKRNEIDKIEWNWQKPTTNREKTTRIKKNQFVFDTLR